MKNLVVYCDMDGVVADFNKRQDAVEVFRKEKGFFRNLDAIAENVAGLKYLAFHGAKIYILTATPHRRADRDKKSLVRAVSTIYSKEEYHLCKNRTGQK